MCSDRVSSVLIYTFSDQLKIFRWDLVLREVKQNAPTLLGFLKSCTKTETPRKNQTAILCFVASVILKFHYDKMNVVQKILFLSSMQVTVENKYAWLQ